VAEIPASAVPTGTEGGGAYNRNSRVQAIALSPAVLMMERAARVVAVLPESQRIVLAEYGSSQAPGYRTATHGDSTPKTAGLLKTGDFSFDWGKRIEIEPNLEPPIRRFDEFLNINIAALCESSPVKGFWRLSECGHASSAEGRLYCCAASLAALALTSTHFDS
jgi:hypothetical protein